MIVISKKQIITIHTMLIKRTGGMDGVRDENLLDSAMKAPFQTFEGQELYPTVQKKGACLCYSLVNNHAFIDGNKRIGILAMMIFMEINGMGIECSNEELIQLGLGIAAGEISQEMILKWILNHYSSI